MAMPIRPIFKNEESFSDFHSILTQNAYQYWVNKFIDPVDELLDSRVNRKQILDLRLKNQLIGNQSENYSSSRSVLLIKLFQYVNELNDSIGVPNEDIFKIAALGEYDMSIMYHENHIRDQKHGVKWHLPDTVEHKRKLKQSLIQHKEAFIDKHFEGDTRKSIKVANQFMHDVHDLIGMMLDKDFTTVNMFKANIYPVNRIQEEIQKLDSYAKYMDVFEGSKGAGSVIDLVNSEEFIETLGTAFLNNTDIIGRLEYLKLYFSRCFLLNVIFYYVYARLIVKLYGTPEKDYSGLISFARHFGLIQQITNDISDFIPVDQGFIAPCKHMEDTFNDLREGTITLPTMYLLSKNVGKDVETYLSGDKNTIDLSASHDQHLILSNYLQSGSIANSISFVRKLAVGAHSLLDPTNPATEILRSLLAFVNDNKYFEFYRKYSGTTHQAEKVQKMGTVLS